MIQLIKGWLKKLQEIADKDSFEEGFGWAMTEYYIRKVPMQDIYAKLYDVNDPFDQGGLEALHTIEKI